MEKDKKDKFNYDKFTWKEGDLQKVEQIFTFYERTEDGKKRKIATMSDLDNVVMGEKSEKLDYIQNKVKSRDPFKVGVISCFKDDPDILVESRTTDVTKRL